VAAYLHARIQRIIHVHLELEFEVSVLLLGHQIPSAATRLHVECAVDDLPPLLREGVLLELAERLGGSAVEQDLPRSFSCPGG